MNLERLSATTSAQVQQQKEYLLHKFEIQVKKSLAGDYPWYANPIPNTKVGASGIHEAVERKPRTYHLIFDLVTTFFDFLS